ncbi:hypothetical protein EPD60_15230 [Flaviaesturariibacter flavus]|uniref:Outer membrane protein beta-barrel domain-containing protein n=1 Tax=Flaviaesturariibacter flavus TaxID=2502780 RepID=A0A4R1B714_9BACT|nr:hypothetical protein [Flaviaesturariibacter flavus]TCJ12617.1 hypothetical protein EPD60_15230 [Flaviaesturariibacter flavus]
MSLTVRLLSLLSLFPLLAGAQDTAAVDARLKFLYFPQAPARAWTVGVGVSATTMPYEITEELHYRIPALEVQALRKIGADFSLFGRASLQAVQNYVSLGPRWSRRLTKRTSLSLGDDVAFWFGAVNVQGFRTKATGVQNFPNATVGIRMKKQVLLSLRAEQVMTLDVSPRAGDIKIYDNYKLFSGAAFTVMLEQPFYGRNKRMALGFRALYTSFFWQTWTAFSTFDRNFFYPQLIACLIL